MVYAVYVLAGTSCEQDTSCDTSKTRLIVSLLEHYIAIFVLWTCRGWTYL